MTESIGTETIGSRVLARRKALDMSQADLAEASGLRQPTISALERGAAKDTRNIATLAMALEVNALWLQTGLGDPHAMTKGRLIEVPGVDGEMPYLEYEIELADSRGTCGGAVDKTDVVTLAKRAYPIIKDRSFFENLGVQPDEVIALIADGDSGANYIVHGDTVFISTRHNEFASGEIFALQAAHGKLIKRLIAKADGHVILSCDNPDKARYPDEVYTSEEFAKLTIIGRLIYRQG